MINEKYTYATFITGDGSYFPGVVALKKSLDKVHSKYPLTVFVPDSIDKITKNKILKLGISVIEINPVTIPKEITNLNKQSSFVHWNESFLKIKIFSQTAYKKIVLLDSDMLVVKNVDHLFESPNLSAVIAGKQSNPNYQNLNSGLIVIEPKSYLADKIYDSFNCIVNNINNYKAIGDQDLLHLAFPDWKRRNELHLPEGYNLLSDCVARYLHQRKGGKRIFFTKDIYIVHFACNPKPWNYTFKAWKKTLLRALRYKNIAEIKFILQYRKLLDF